MTFIKGHKINVGNNWNKGKKFSDEHKRKIGLAGLGKKWTPEQRERINESRKRYIYTDEHRKNNSIAQKGKVLSDETKKKISDGLKGKNLGEKRWNWNGGISRDKHGTPENMQWRSDVFQRDNWTCQTCGLRGCYLEAHHIKSWAKYPELRYELNNGVTLCKDCHKLTDSYGRPKKV